MIELSKPIQRLVAVGILIAAIGIVNAIIIKPAVSLWQAHRNQMEMRLMRLSRYKNILSSYEALSLLDKELSAKIDSAGILRAGDTPAMIAAEIQSQIRQTVLSAGGTVLSTAELPVEPKGAFSRICVRATAEGDLSSVTGFLSASETDKPALFINNMRIHAADLIQPQLKQKLSLEFDVCGYSAGGA
ncbi:MAG: type II secretion system protein GspM [Alphaproteobacteria bacterium]|nr:type II secretion system protein GspM [Alphaproteobacteria bacterium]